MKVKKIIQHKLSLIEWLSTSPNNKGVKTIEKQLFDVESTQKCKKSVSSQMIKILIIVWFVGN